LAILGCVHLLRLGMLLISTEGGGKICAGVVGNQEISASLLLRNWVDVDGVRCLVVPSEWLVDVVVR
jgi:hypothetical protein